MPVPVPATAYISTLYIYTYNDTLYIIHRNAATIKPSFDILDILPGPADLT